MKLLPIAGIVLAAAVLLPLAGWLYFERVANPRVIQELADEPDGERARKVMLLTLPSGRSVPVNYLREDDMVYAGADGPWWHELAEGEQPVTLLLRGETLSGLARAVQDDPDHTRDVFSRLRPTALSIMGVMVEITLHDAPAR